MSIAIKLTKMWLGYRPGQVFPIMPDGQANALIRRGIAELADVLRTDPGSNEDSRPAIRAGDTRRSKKEHRAS